MTSVERTPDTATDPALEAVLPADIAGHLARMCEVGFPVNWTSDAGDLSFTGIYDACSSDEQIYSDMDEQRALCMVDSLGGHDDPDFDYAYEYWVEAVGLSRTCRTLAQRIRTAAIECDAVTVRVAAADLRGLASGVQPDSDAHRLLLAVTASLEAWSCRWKS